MKKEQEARLVSIGLLSNFDISDGLIVDLGGGSLELVHITNGKPINFKSLNVGHLSIKPQHEIFDMIKIIIKIKVNFNSFY